MDKTDMVQLHKGTKLKGNVLCHEAMGIRVELNDTGRWIAESLIDRDGATVHEINRKLAFRFSVPEVQIARDTRQFIEDLDGRELIKITRFRPRGLFPKAVDLIVGLATFRWTEEIRRGTRCYRPTALNTLRATYRSQQLLLLLLMGSGPVMGALVQFLAYDTPAKSGAVMLAALLPMWLAAVHFILLTVHELGHIYALRGFRALLSDRCVVMQRGFMVYIIHKRVGARRELAVALTGPLAALLAGGILSAASLASPFDDLVIPSGFTLMPAVLGSIHLLSLLPLSGDGKAILSAWRRLRKAVP